MNEIGFPTPAISICIPAHKAEAYLAETLQSVRAQTFENWELIVTEDGSSDRTRAITEEFQKSVRQRVIYNRHESNRGLPATRNTGMGVASGEWIALIDSDDLWLPDHLAALMGKAQTSGADLIFSGTTSFESTSGADLSHFLATEDQLQKPALALFMGELSILPSSVMIRRAVFQRLGPISTDFPHVNDTEYWLRLLYQEGRLAYSGRDTMRYRKHSQSMSRKAAELLEDSARLCKHYSDWSEIPPKIAQQRVGDLYRWAARAILLQNRREAFRLLRIAFREDPFNINTAGLYLKACLTKRPSASAATTGT